MPHGFIRQFIKSPSAIGAIAPSSARLAREMVSNVGLETARVVVEYGPGTGAFTSAILARRNPNAVFFAVENNRKMAAAFRKRFPDVLLFEESVENLPAILGRVGEPEVGCIVSGLPWASFSADLQDRLLEVTHSVLRKGGSFSTFAYLQGLLLPSGMRFRKRLEVHFSQVSKSRVVWRNLPPAFVYRCVK